MEFWISKFEKCINKILSLDKETCYELGKFDKQVIAFEFENTQTKIYITTSENGLSIDDECSKDPDVLIKSTPINFIRLLLSSKTKTPDIPIDMQVVGDINLARDFQKVMSNLQTDFEEPLSRILGDTLAFQIGNFLRKAEGFTSNITEKMILDISEYLRFEIEMLPDELLVDEFSKEVDSLRDETELISKRVEKLNHFLMNNESNN